MPSVVIPFGAVCKAKCTAPARSLGNGRCLYISAMCNELAEDDAVPAEGGEGRFPLPDDEELRLWLADERPALAKAGYSWPHQQG